MEFEILLTQPYTMDSTPHGPGKPDNHDKLGWPDDPDGSNQPDDTNESSRPNDPNKIDDLDESGGLEYQDRPNQPYNQDGSACPMTHTSLAGQTT